MRCIKSASENFNMIKASFSFPDAKKSKNHDASDDGNEVEFFFGAVFRGNETCGNSCHRRRMREITVLATPV